MVDEVNDVVCDPEMNEEEIYKKEFFIFLIKKIFVFTFDILVNIFVLYRPVVVVVVVVVVDDFDRMMIDVDDEYLD